ncbi:hypothetical protein QN277_016803 [Acacia crassicarpa]|uniref:Secreted protein n=1 Tax=Acacia crassicarpa TaxID=499986 RepID=A0AAE1MXI5_9FABA|nr:hypothetical protein QN277_016803 [Acacia crassicarpa]
MVSLLSCVSSFCRVYLTGGLLWLNCAFNRGQPREAWSVDLGLDLPCSSDILNILALTSSSKHFPFVCSATVKVFTWSC